MQPGVPKSHPDRNQLSWHCTMPNTVLEHQQCVPIYPRWAKQYNNKPAMHNHPWLAVIPAREDFQSNFPMPRFQTHLLLSLHINNSINSYRSPHLLSYSILVLHNICPSFNEGATFTSLFLEDWYPSVTRGHCLCLVCKDYILCCLNNVYYNLCVSLQWKSVSLK